MQTHSLTPATHQIIVLDFDCTITRTHTGGCARSAIFRANNFIHSNIKPGFQQFVTLAMDQGLRLYIATYGDDNFANSDNEVAGHQLVKLYMDTLFGENQQLFNLPSRLPIKASHDYNNIIASYSNDRKQTHLEVICLQESLTLSNKPALQKLLLVDDDPVNVEYFSSKGCSSLDRDPILAAEKARDDALFLNIFNYIN